VRWPKSDFLVCARRHNIGRCAGLSSTTTNPHPCAPHPWAITLMLMMKRDLRQEFASYISKQAAIAGYKTLIPANLQKASDLAVANLYWYFKVRDETEAEAVTA
jgi:hypothetical protein